MSGEGHKGVAKCDTLYRIHFLWSNELLPHQLRQKENTTSGGRSWQQVQEVVKQGYTWHRTSRDPIKWAYMILWHRVSMEHKTCDFIVTECKFYKKCKKRVHQTPRRGTPNSAEGYTKLRKRVHQTPQGIFETLINKGRAGCQFSYKLL